MQGFRLHASAGGVGWRHKGNFEVPFGVSVLYVLPSGEGLSITESTNPSNVDQWGTGW